MNIPDPIRRLFIEDGKVYIETVKGEVYQQDVNLPYVTGAVFHPSESAIVATDGVRVVKTDGRVVVDITDEFGPNP